MLKVAAEATEVGSVKHKWWWRVGSLVAALPLLLSPAPVAAAGDGDVPHRAQVVAGDTAAPGAHPSTVALVVEGTAPAQGQFCGGTLVRPDWVLTAAHCVTAPAPTRFDVLLGTQNLLEGGERVPVAAVHVHEGWSPTATSVPNDIALVQLARSASQPVLDLVRADQSALWPAGTTATLAGWGGLTTDMDDQLFPAQLQEAQMPVVADPTCRSRLGGAFVSSSMLCAGAPGDAPVGGPDACNGDSGGPLTVPGPAGRPLQIGIVSWGQSCGLTFTAYTEIAVFRPWIDAVIGPEPAPEPVPDPAGTAPGQTFSDVAGNAHQVSIEGVAAAGIAGGYPDGTFRPASPVTRGQMATFLQRALQLPAAAPAPFADSVGSPHAAAVDAVFAAGIAGGFADGTYRPDAPVTRGQMATFLTRALQLPFTFSTPFTDVEGNGHAASIGAVATAGIASGYGDGTYRPGVAVTRGQMATFLYRAFLT